MPFPHDIAGIAERLKYRLIMGLVVDMHVPRFETKIAILKRKQKLIMKCLLMMWPILLPPGYSNVRELEGSLIRVMAFASLTGQTITLDLAKKVLYRTGHEKKSHLSFEQVVDAVSKYYACDLELLKSKERNKESSIARHVAMFLMKKTTDKTLRDIGIFLGGRDHSTVMHALSKVEHYAKTDKEFKQKLEHIEKYIDSLKN